MNFSCKPKDGASVTLTERVEGSLIFLDVDVAYPEPTVPATLTVTWKIECVDMYSTWSAGMKEMRKLAPSWNAKKTSARLALGAPLHQIVSANGRNRMTVALSDAMTPTEIQTGVVEKTAMLNCNVCFFTMPINKITEYHATIRIDLTDRPYHESLKDAERYWAGQCGYPSAYTPDTARRPVYSCWYSFHQDIDVEAIVEQCRLAKAMGMESVIVDDGWQTENSSGGYGYCGDWEVAPSKVPDMKAFVDAVHETGLKFIIWFSVPFMGIYAKQYERFKDMLLGYKWPNCGVLDPRYPEVREYLIAIYKKAVREWGLDGVKLDFIDSFMLFPDTPAFDERWDTLSLEDGVDKLLHGIVGALREANPEILIEFRQSYFGPVIRKYGNMIRVADCPNDSFMNHAVGADLRFLLGKTPVHSDMLMWHNEDTVESAAHQVICTLFTVPQISVLLDKIPESHQKMLKFWLAFWNDNRETLLDGDFTAENPESLYSIVKSEREGKVIAVSHAKPVLTVGDFKSLAFINASSESELIVRAAVDGGKRAYTVLDCMGRVIDRGERRLDQGLHAFSVPRCGMIQVE